MSERDARRDAGRTQRERETGDDAMASRARMARLAPATALPPKLVLSLTDGPEALHRAFLRMRSVSERDRR